MLKALATFFRSELFSWFWQTYGAPIALAALYVAVGIITNQYGPLVVLGAAFTFALGAIGSAAIEQQRYLHLVRTQLATGKGKPALVLPDRKLLRKGPPPQIPGAPVQRGGSDSDD